MNRNLRFVAPVAAALTLSLGLAACGAGNESGSDGGSGDGVSGTLNAGGASSQQSAVDAWKSAFQSANSGATVNYDPAGSGAGREQFIAGGFDFAGSDAYLDDEELASAKERCGDGEVVEFPVYVSPIAIVYNLDGVDELNLSPKLAADIFLGKVKTWDDAAIKAENPDATLPSTAITPVHRSDDSGTTENFTQWLNATSDGAWAAEPSQTWPTKGGEAAEGTSGVIQSVTNGQGTIGYADESQAGDLGIAKVKVGESYNEPSAEGAATVVDASPAVEGRSDTDVAIDIDRTVTDEGAYPVVLVSYQIGCTTYDDADKAALVKAWFQYVTGSEGQDAAAKAAGSAPLGEGVAEKVKAAVDAIQTS